MDEVKLLGAWPSPFSLRIELALKLKGIPYEYIEEDMSNRSPLLLKSNPVHKKIPVLIHTGKPIAESFLILEYIDETWQHNPILPKDPYDRAIARFWANFIDDKIWKTILKATAAEEEKVKEHFIEEIGQQLKVLENELKEKEYFAGGSIGYFDIMAFFIVYAFELRQKILESEVITEGKCPILWRWMSKLCEIDVVSSCLPPRDEHFAYIRTRVEAARSALK